MLIGTNGIIHLPDSFEYLSKAKCLFGDCDFNAEEFAKRPFGYPLLLQVFGQKITVVLQFLIVLFLIGFGAKRISNEKKSIQIFYLLSTTLSLSVFIYANAVMAEVIVMTLLVLSAILIAKRKWFFAVLVISSLPFFKPVFLFVAPVFLLLFVLYKPLRQPVLIVGMLLSMFANFGYMKFVEQQTGVFEFSSIQHINALQYNKHQFDVARFGADSALVIQNEIRGVADKLPYPKKVAAYNQAFFRDLKTIPFQYAFFHIKGAMRGVLDPGRFDINLLFPDFAKDGFLHREGSFYAFIKSVDVGSLLILGALMLFNLIRFLLAVVGLFTKRKSPVAWYTAALIIYLVLVTGPINASRFMVPLVPFLIHYSIEGLKFLVQKRVL